MAGEYINCGCPTDVIITTKEGLKQGVEEHLSSCVYSADKASDELHARVVELELRADRLEEELHSYLQNSVAKSEAFWKRWFNL
jgi:uncharacterized protein YhaN